MAMQQRVTIEALPPELLSNVFEFLDSAPPSDTRLHDQPKRDMFRVSETDLKSVSLVSRRWRGVVLPLLFRHASWSLDRWDLPVIEPDSAARPPDNPPFLRFLRDNNLGRYVDTLVIRMENSRKNHTRRAEIGRILDQAGSNAAGDGLDQDAAAPVNEKTRARTQQHVTIMNRWAIYDEDVGWFWNLIFATVDPLRLTLVASPQILASLLARAIFLGDAWSFDPNPLHILSLSRDTRSMAKAGGSKRPPRQDESSSAASGSCISFTRPPTTPPEDGDENGECLGSSTPSDKANRLFTIRPWKHLLLNEGSSTRVYRNYEYYLRRPPSILGALLGGSSIGYNSNKPIFPSTVTSFAYVAIFPLSGHFSTLIEKLPRVDRLFVQLVPRNDILRDKDEMRLVQPSDLWMERNSCYSKIMQELLTTNDLWSPGPAAQSWRQLRVFESGDAADKEAWNLAVQYVHAASGAWRIESEGIFVRNDPDPPKENPLEPPTTNDPDEHLPAPTDILSVPPATFSSW